MGGAARSRSTELRADAGREPLPRPPHNGASTLEQVLPPCSPPRLHWNEPEWNWFAESLDTAAVLARAGYDFRLVVGDGGHSPNHGGSSCPTPFRWLWHPSR